MIQYLSKMKIIYQSNLSKILMSLSKKNMIISKKCLFNLHTKIKILDMTKTKYVIHMMEKLLRIMYLSL